MNELVRRVHEVCRGAGLVIAQLGGGLDASIPTGARDAVGTADGAAGA